MIIGICMVKNEEDIIEMTLRHFIAEGLDHILVANNLSYDGTNEILERLQSEFPEKLFVIEDNEPAYYQAVKMNNWIKLAIDLWGENTWIIPFDADEIWSHTGSMKLVDYFRTETASVVYCPVWDMIPSFDTNTTRPSRDILFRSPSKEVHPVVAFRYHPGVYLQQGNHYVENGGTPIWGPIEVCHFQYRSLKQFKNKLRNGKQVYDITNLDYGIGQHWREGGAMTDEQLTEKWRQYCGQSKVLIPCYPKGQLW